MLLIEKFAKEVQSYENSREWIEFDVTPKKEFLLTREAMIAQVFTKTYYKRKYMQHFSRGQIQAM